MVVLFPQQGMLPLIDENTPAGTSVRTAAQFAMNFNSGKYNEHFWIRKAMLSNRLRSKRVRYNSFDNRANIYSIRFWTFGQFDTLW